MLSLFAPTRVVSAFIADALYFPDSTELNSKRPSNAADREALTAEPRGSPPLSCGEAMICLQENGNNVFPFSQYFWTHESPDRVTLVRSSS
jgi:hypothetical protein